MIENVKVANSTLGILIRDYPEITFFAIKDLFSTDSSFLFSIIDYNLFTEAEIIELIALINESTLPG